MGSIISLARTGLIPDRLMIYNVLLASELIMGYSKSNQSPRCMINMDLKQA